MNALAPIRVARAFGEADDSYLARTEPALLSQWKALRADFEKRATELLSQSSFAADYVPDIKSGISEPSDGAWEDYIARSAP